MQIGKLNFDIPVFLAPMAGVTDMAYRILAREMGCELVYSEMVSDKGINYRNSHTLEMLRTVPEERPMAMQLFGAEPESVAKAAAFVRAWGVLISLISIWAVRHQRWSGMVRAQHLCARRSRRLPSSKPCAGP